MIASFYCSIFGTHLSTEGINRGRYSSKNFMLIIINILLQVYAPHSGHLRIFLTKRRVFNRVIKQPTSAICFSWNSYLQFKYKRMRLRRLM